MGGLQGEMSLELYDDFMEWLNSSEAVQYIKINTWTPNKVWSFKENCKMITPLARFSYCNVFEPAQTPSGDMKYSVSILIPKEDTKGIQAINEAIQIAITKGLEKNTFNKMAVKSLRLPLRDGDAEHEDGSRGAEYKGFLFMNAASKNQPGVVDSDLAQIMNKDDFYSGVWGHADINFFPYNTAGNKGIGVGLNNLMKKKDGDRLDGRQKAEDAFAEYAEEDQEVHGEVPDDLT